MTDTMTTGAGAKDHSYDGPKAGRRGDGTTMVEVRVRAERRRPWTDEDKLRIVRETLVPGTVVQAVADRHGVSTGQLYTWRNLNTKFREELDLERESAKFRDAWHYVWVAPGVLTQWPAVPAETGRAA